MPAYVILRCYKYTVEFIGRISSQVVGQRQAYTDAVHLLVVIDKAVAVAVEVLYVTSEGRVVEYREAPAQLDRGAIEI